MLTKTNAQEAQSIAGTVVNFLSALSLVNNGVREILPFVRYIAQFIDYEFNTIKKEDKGKGVVPRPWDFPDPPADLKRPATHGDDLKSNLPASDAPPDMPSDSEPLSPPPETPPLAIISPSLPTFADGIVGAYADSVHFQPMASASRLDVK
ncbi:hypothetical protein DXG03_006720 [Asterophora parasitica]|uniref:Uncharacterized protein n=1 Tax=Asterophora parasitica TaxID=117018 RepID=A0A9P7GDH3_9AGAR|nr:hypothetical protein DXG03_006720 [Asterophora parasitica]